MLLELALRHLLGGRFSHFIAYRWRRWLSALATLAITIGAGVYIARSGSPVWGAVSFFGLGFLLFMARRALHGPLPSHAAGAYATAITFVAVTGIALAVMALIVVVSVMDGFSRDIQTALLKTTPEVMVTNMTESLEMEVLDAVRKVPGVVNAEPYVENELLMKLDGLQRPLPIILRGVTPEYIARSSAPSLVKGSWESLKEPGKIVVGAELARLYWLNPGDEVWLLSSEGTITPLGISPTMERYTVGGVFETGFYEVDQKMVIAGIATAQSLFGMEGRYSGIDVGGLADPFDAPELARTIHSSVMMPLWVRSWAETRKNLYEAMKTEKAAMFIIELLLILIASFNITSTLFMAISRKTREIGLLLSLGMTRARIAVLFSIEGLLIGATGATIGVLTGTAFALYLKYFPISMPGGGSVYYIDTVPVHISPGLIAAAFGSAILLSFFASIYPALGAARMKPAKALRFE